MSWEAMDPKGYSPEIAGWLKLHGFEDSSWHNDISPSFERPSGQGDDVTLRLWIDNAAIEERDGANPRFELQVRDGTELVITLGMSERWGVMAEFIESMDDMSQMHPATVLGTPVERSDFDSSELEDLTGFTMEDLEIGGVQVMAALIYRDALFILRLADGRFWTIINRDEYLGTQAECEIALAEFAESEGYGK